MAKQAVKRIDPSPRPTDGVSAWTKLSNRDINRHYVWVSKVGDAMDDYSAAGYVIELDQPGGVKPQGGRLSRKPGEQIEFRGNVLMSCSLERKAEIDEHGVDGDSGQRAADAIENRMIDKERGLDPLRGIGTGRFLRFRAEAEHDTPIMGGD